MSYSRFSATCEVYTFANCDGFFECCGCIIYGHLHPKTWFQNRTELVEHLREHQRAGHKVPEHVIISILHDEVA